jgi:hypothetical protein
MQDESSFPKHIFNKISAFGCENYTAILYEMHHNKRVIGVADKGGAVVSRLLTD